MGFFSKRPDNTGREQVRSKIVAARDSSLTAAGLRVTDRNAQEIARLSQAWQQQAFGYYQSIGEIWYAAQFYARALSQLRLYVGRKDDQGEVTELDDNDPAAELLDRVQDPGGGQSGLLGAYGRLQFLAGEGFLTVTQWDDGEEAWEFLSSLELQVKGDNRYLRYRAPGLPPIEYRTTGNSVTPGGNDGVRDAVVYRMWRKDPTYSWQADGPMRAVLTLCEELELLTLSIRGRAKSRAAQSGILMVAQELSFGSPDGLDDEDPNTDPFQTQLQKTLVHSISTPGAAAQFVPIVVRVPWDMMNENSLPIALLELSRGDESYPEEALRTELIKRIAQGLDLPPEILLGMSDANHWTAWQIDDNTWTAHLQPMAQQLVDDFTTTYLRPVARDQGIEDWQSLVVAYDAAAVVNHPDKFKDAMELFDRGLVSGEYVRDAAGASDTDAQTPDEHQEWLAIRLQDPLILDTAEGGDQPTTAPADNASDTLEQPPAETVMEDTLTQPNVNASAALVLGAAELALIRAREAAGAKIRVKLSNGKSPLRDKVHGCSNASVASILGADCVNGFNLTAQGLVAGSFGPFTAVAEKYGVDGSGSAKLVQLIERHAAETLFQEDPGGLPSSFGAYVQRLIKT